MAESLRGRKIGRHVRRALLRLAVLFSVALVPAYVFLVAPSLNRLQATSWAPSERPLRPVQPSPSDVRSDAGTSPSPSKPSPTASLPPTFPPAGAVFLGVSASQLPWNHQRGTRFHPAT